MDDAEPFTDDRGRQQTDPGECTPAGCEYKGRLVFRMPVIPEFNDHEEHILQIAGFLSSIGKDEINILPLHHMGREKHSFLGKSYYTSDFSTPSKESLQLIQKIFNNQGITCYAGSDTPF